MNATDRANAIIQDILTNHLPRIKEGLEKGYVDENQILLVYDHAVRARTLREHGCKCECTGPEKDSAACALVNVLNEHHDVMSRIESELETEERPVIVGTEFSPVETRVKDAGQKIVNVPMPGVPSGVLKQVQEDPGLAIVRGYNTLEANNACYVQVVAAIPSDCKMTTERGRAAVMTVEAAKALAKELTDKYADMEFQFESVSHEWKQHVDKIECACGGLVKEFPCSPESLLKCDKCGRVYTDEEEALRVKRSEAITPTKCADATYWTTGTLAGGTTPVPMETEINLNGRRTTIKAVNGKFVLTYEQIVRMAVNQRRGPLNAFTGSDEELPHETVVYHHRCDFKQLPGERDGSLWKGKSVECTPGMCIDCCNTGNA